MTAIFQTKFSNAFSWMKIYEFRFKISLKFVPKVRINNILAFVQILAWRWPVNKPFSEPMMAKLLTHICITQPEWVNELNVAYLMIPNVSKYPPLPWVPNGSLKEMTTLAMLSRFQLPKMRLPNLKNKIMFMSNCFGITIESSVQNCYIQCIDSINPWTLGNTWVHSQHCGYWCPGAKAPGHQYPQYWLNLQFIGPVSYENIRLLLDNIRK